MEGVGAAGGIGIGRLWRPRPLNQPAAGSTGTEAERAVTALRRLAAELASAADALRRLALPAEADILAASSLAASDPVLLNDVLTRVAHSSAVAALTAATTDFARRLEVLGDPALASRAADVRGLGRRAVGLLGEDGGGRGAPPPGAILAVGELGPGDVAAFAGDRGVAGIALAGGAVVSHAAIVARALGVPMVVALGPAVLGIREGEEVCVDGGAGTVLVRPGPGAAAHARAARRGAPRDPVAVAAGRTETADGQPIRLMCNAGSATEVSAGLAAGAEGAGLVRTELAFLSARQWPGEEECRQALAPVLEPLAGRTATVRVFDFGGDKVPPFLGHCALRGTGLMLAHEAQLRDQLRAMLRAGAGTRLRILAPLAETAAQLAALRQLLGECARQIAWAGPLPPVGAMIETPTAAEQARAMADEADFLAIGTNDLVHFTLGGDRAAPHATPHDVANPQVLRLIARVIAAASAAGIGAGVCGEAAGDPSLAWLLIGLGVRELSVAPSQLGRVRDEVRRLSARDAAAGVASRLATPASRADS